MEDELPNLRCERKFVAEGLSLSEALAMVRRHPALFRETYPSRVVNNLYLDSPALNDYFDHIHGTANRVKTRIRWYGNLAGHIAAPSLERKMKRGLASGKAAYPMRPLTVNGGIKPHDLEAALTGDGLPPALQTALRHLSPALVNRYRRHYFESADGRVRLTVDSDLQFLAVRHATGTFAPVTPRVPCIIFELKFAPGDAERAAAVTNALPFALTRCSKYVLGIEQLHALRHAL